MIHLAYGLPGTGKSTLLHDFVRLYSQDRRLFVVDHESGWGPDSLHWRGNPPELLYVHTPDDMDSLRYKAVWEWPERGVWVFQGALGEEVAKLAEHVGSVTYVDDELDVIARRKGWDDSALRRIAHQGRHLVNAAGEITECSILGACRRPQNIHTDITQMYDDAYLFRLRGSRTQERVLADAMCEDVDWDIIRKMPDFWCFNTERRTYEPIQPVGTPRDQRDYVVPPERSPSLTSNEHIVDYQFRATDMKKARRKKSG